SSWASSPRPTSRGPRHVASSPRAPSYSTDLSFGGASRPPNRREGISHHSLLCNRDGPDHPVFIESQFIDAHDAMIAVGLAQRPPVIHDVPLAGRRLKHGMVAGTRGHR